MSRGGWFAALVVLVVCCWVWGGEGPKQVLRPKPLLPKPVAAPETARTKAALNKKLSFDFVETPLRDVLTFLGESLRVNIVLDPALDPGTPITLRVKDMSGGNALSWIARLAGGEMRVEDGAVLVAPPKDKRAGQGRLLGKFQVRVGKLGMVELYLYDDLIEPDLRRMLAHVLRVHLAEQLQQAEQRIEMERAEREKLRKLKEQKLRKPERGKEQKGGQF